MSEKKTSYHQQKGHRVPTVHYPYVKITLGQGDTAFSLTTGLDGDKGGRPNYFVSLEHKRYTDLANTLTIVLQFVPQGNYDENKPEMNPWANPNYIENAIHNQNICLVQYGSTKDVNLSAEYKGVIYDYNTTLSESGLQYTIYAVSSTVAANYEQITNSKWSVWCASDESDAGKTSNTPEQILQKMANIIAESPSLKDNWEFDIDGSDKDFEVTKTTRVDRYSPMRFLREVAQTLVCKSNTDDSTNKSYYHIVTLSPKKGSSKGQIRLIKSGAVDWGDFLFKWASRDSDVISWSPKFQGVYTIFGPGGKIRKDDDPFKDTTASFEKDSGGNTGGYSASTFKGFDDASKKSIANLAGDVDLSSTMTEATKDIQKYKDKIQYPYSATLTTLGVVGGPLGPEDEIILGQSALRVTPLINGQVHHSAGTYLIIGVTDNVSNTGFTTTFDLVKYTEAYSTDEDVKNSLSNPKDGGDGPRRLTE